MSLATEETFKRKFIEFLPFIKNSIYSVLYLLYFIILNQEERLTMEGISGLTS